MFTGIVEGLADVAAVANEPPGVRLVVRAPFAAVDARVGDSIAVSGCCLTAVDVAGDAIAFNVGPETLRRTNLGQLAAGGGVNLERSLRASDRLGGHFVTGHIDGVGTLAARDDAGEWSTLWFAPPGDLLRYIVPQGCIAVDGVSLTVVEVSADRFSAMLIPHTLAVTTLGRLAVGGRVNLESDLPAKYAAKLLAGAPLADPRRLC